jgi:hypothetical protein
VPVHAYQVSLKIVNRVWVLPTNAVMLGQSQQKSEAVCASEVFLLQYCELFGGRRVQPFPVGYQCQVCPAGLLIAKVNVDSRRNSSSAFKDRQTKWCWCTQMHNWETILPGHRTRRASSRGR